MFAFSMNAGAQSFADSNLPITKSEFKAKRTMFAKSFNASNDQIQKDQFTYNRYISKAQDGRNFAALGIVVSALGAVAITATKVNSNYDSPSQKQFARGIMVVGLSGIGYGGYTYVTSLNKAKEIEEKYEF